MPFPVSWLGINTVVLRQAISVLSFVCCIYNHLVLCPLINKARDAAEDGERRQHALCCSSFLQKAVMRSLHSRGCDGSYKGGSLCFAVAAAQRGAPSTVGVSGEAGPPAACAGPRYVMEIVREDPIWCGKPFGDRLPTAVGFSITCPLPSAVR